MFVVGSQGTSNSKGQVSLCVPKDSLSPVLVISALNASQHAYPTAVIPLMGSYNVGTVLLGSCRGTCGFVNQAETSAEAV